ncbi:peroxiredoxin [Sulfuritortus calidifontis]|uniref:Peroxiredoxin n=1 Tax=Sulfuritortus calidifontis TaxID=1914471 RepID=A0A4R3JNE8_9PROT|nr:TlpA disulfide reductase family protein [Sulfuritortus calidifontis]TCS68038.1 peroxiredoxin [Sulfuritortus calidifontis]
MAPFRQILSFAGLALMLAASARAEMPLEDVGAVPHLDARGKAAYLDYLKADGHKAFFVAPGGHWSWRAEMGSVEAAEDAALRDCQENTEQRCVPYAVNDRVVFNAKAWPRLWGPYLSRAQAEQAPVGLGRGMRFPDLAFKDPQGKPTTLKDLRGKVVVLHFWGSWCPPCLKEMPELRKTALRLRDERDIVFTCLQVREDFATAKGFVKQKLKLDLALSDSQVKGPGKSELPLSDGSTLPDRQLAKVFPTTYVLDKHGIVLFSHNGPIPDWTEYIAFLRDAAARSGR